MDSAVKYMGAGHRSVNHSSKILEGMEILFGQKGRNVALLHLLIDNKVIDVENLQLMIRNRKTRERCAGTWKSV